MCDRGIYFASILEFLRLDFGTALTVGYVLILTVRYVLTVGYVLVFFSLDIPILCNNAKRTLV